MIKINHRWLAIIVLALCSTEVFGQDFNLVDNKPPVAAQPEAAPASGGSGEAAPSFILASTSPATTPPIIPGDFKYELPALEIGGADSTYPLGEMVQLWIKPIAKKPEFLESVAYTWTVLPGRKSVVWPDSSRLLFGTGIQDGTYTVLLTASYVYVEPSDDANKPTIVQRAVTKTVQVEVGNGGPGDPGPGDPGPGDPGPGDPGPGDPGPGDPGPGDPGPDLSGLAQSAYDWTAFVEVGPDYGSQNVKSDAAVLANNFAQVAKEIEDGELTRVSDILARTKSLNDNGTVNRNAWLPWFSKMSAYLSQSYNNGILTTPEQYGEAWKQISQGLAAAAQ